MLFVALEIAWRVARASPSEVQARMRFSASENGVGYTLNPFFQMVYPPDERTDPGPHFAGWRVEPPNSGLAPGRKRILFLGGSTTQNDYPSLVRAALEPSIGPVTIYNMGYSWHTSLHSLYKFWTYVDEIHPDLVVELEAINDLCRGFTSPAHSLPQYREDYSHAAGALNAFWTVGRSRIDGRSVFCARPAERFERSLAPRETSVRAWIDELANSSELVRSLTSTFARDRATRPHEIIDMDDALVLRALPAFRRNLANLRDGCEAKHVPILFLTMPFSVDTRDKTFLYPSELLTNDGEHYLSAKSFAHGMQSFNSAVCELATEPRVAVLDLASQLTDVSLFDDEVHLKSIGLKREAQLVVDAILAHSWIATR